jgi:hypothetical protein
MHDGKSFKLGNKFSQNKEKLQSMMLQIRPELRPTCGLFQSHFPKFIHFITRKEDTHISSNN